MKNNKITTLKHYPELGYIEDIKDIELLIKAYYKVSIPEVEIRNIASCIGLKSNTVLFEYKNPINNVWFINSFDLRFINRLDDE